MIDKNGKLFGKLNIIDLLIILVIVAAIAFLGVKVLGRDNVDLGTPTTVRLTFYADDAPGFLEGKAKVGDPFIDYDHNHSFGNVTALNIEPAYTYAYDEAAHTSVKVPTVNRCFITVSCEAEGYLSDNSFVVDGDIYAIGGSYTIRVGLTRFASRLANIEVINK